MLQTDQLSNIGLLLGKFGTVSVPGLGTFCKVTESAYFSSHRDQLFPPFQTIKFDESYDATYDIYKLFQKSGYRQDISGGINSINAEIILSEIKSEGFCNISGVGKLILDNNCVKLISDDVFLHGDYWGLDKINTSPVPLNHPRNNPASLNTNTAIFNQLRNEKKGALQFRDMILPLLAILFTIILLSLRYMSCNRNETLQSDELTNTTIEPPQLSEENPDDSQTKIIEPSTGNDTSTTTYQPDSSTSPVSGKNNDQTDECIIIVGAFSNEQNVRRMLKKVERAGYIPYIQKNNGLTRVGMSFECKEDDLKDSMKSMRNKFTRDAWYLKPSIAIER